MPCRFCNCVIALLRCIFYVQRSEIECASTPPSVFLASASKPPLAIAASAALRWLRHCHFCFRYSRVYPTTFFPTMIEEAQRRSSTRTPRTRDLRENLVGRERHQTWSRTDTPTEGAKAKVDGRIEGTGGLEEFWGSAAVLPKDPHSCKPSNATRCLRLRLYRGTLSVQSPVRVRSGDQSCCSACPFQGHYS